MAYAYLKNLGLVLILLLVCPLHGTGQVVINEICPTNTSIITNSNGEYDDWLELHNAGASTVNLAGYGLTDDSTKPYQFSFPNFNLSPGQKVIVFASDKSNKNPVDHWEMAVNAGSIWKYAIGSSSLDTNWRNLSYSDAAWASGYCSIGLGDGDDNTIIPAVASVMMRKTFTVVDTSKIIKGVLLMDFDDGFVAYLNGVEIARSNLGTEGFRPGWNELALSSHEAKSYRGLPIDSFYLSPTLMKSAIRPGTNVLSIEVHNTPANSDDITSIPYLFFGMNSPGLTYISIPSWFHVPAKDYFNAKFKIDRYGETLYLYNPSGLVADQITFPITEINHSYCRIPDGSPGWCYTNTPTPETSNNASVCYGSYAAAPVFSRQGGYYTATQTLTLSTTTPGGVIRYTRNGDVPSATSPAYTGPITVSTTQTIRAKVFASGYLPGPLVTNTYIINGLTHLSSFSITTDSANLWDYNTGIYVLGPNADPVTPFKGANYWQDWEKPATIEYYDKNKNLVVKFDADIRIYGNYSRAKPQKSFEIKLKDRYGTGSFTYPIYPDKSYVDQIDNIVLRNAGTDWNKVHFRDAMMERLLKNTYTGYLATEPAIAYLNGQYWGVYHINENHDQHWMENNFGYKRSEIDYLKESGTTMQVQEGSDVSFWNLYNYATTQTPTTQQYYDYINSMLDLNNYTDYFVAETFYNNGDWIGEWTNNLKLWRPKKTGAKWRYLLYDLDYGLGLKGDVTDNRLAMARNPAAFSYSSEMFDAILKNPTYKRYFINRYCDLMNTIFLPSNVNTVMHSYKDYMAYDMPAHFAKWGNSTSYWNSEISAMTKFASDRLDIMKNYIKSEFNMSGVVTLTLKTSPNGSGRIEISTVTPTTYPWTGDYYNGNPVTITAIPNPGYTFDHWKSQKVITSNNPNQSVTYNFNKDDVITAYFTGSLSTPQICISEFNYNSNAKFDAGDWVELHNYAATALDISGWKLKDSKDNHVFVFPTGTKIAANGYLVLVEDSNKFKSQFPSVTNRIGLTGFNFSNGGDQIRLFDYADVLKISFWYSDLAPWPVTADGDGFTCELTSNTANPNNATSWFAGCIGGSPGRAYTPTIYVPLSVSGSTTFCNGSSTVLNGPVLASSTYQWKKNNVNISGAIDSVYNATQAGSYTVSVTNNGCTALTPAIVLTTVAQQPLPVTVSASRCGPGELTLTGSSTDSIFWYTAATGGSQVAAGNTFHIPYLAQTTVYYARTGRNCPSNSVATSAKILLAAASPVCPDTARCGPGFVTLNATDTAEIRWYNAAVGGGLLATGNSFTTNYLENDTSFFIEAGSVCPSPRIEVNIAINTTPAPVVADASRCGNGTLVLTASSSAPVFWYHSPAGGYSVGTGNTFLTPALTETDTFYAEASSGCASARVRSIAIVNPIPPDPIVTDTFLCGPGSVTLFADAVEQVDWYTSATGGTRIFTGPNYTTPNLSASATYYAETGFDCLSNRVPVHVIVSSYPPPPSGTDGTICDSGSVALAASSPQLIQWYDAPTGGNLLATGNSYLTPSLTATTTFYAEAGNYCKSSRTPVQAIINTTPAPPASSSISRCGSGPVTFTATSPQQVYWYNAPSGGTPLATGLTYTTGTLSTTTTFYLETGSACRSSRIPVQAEILPLPPNPVVTNGSRCGNGTVTLNATSSVNLSWYGSQTGGSPIGSGTSFTTPSLSTTTTYYAQADNGCLSARVPVQAVINAIPSPPVAGDVSRCGNGVVVLTASSPETIKWYNAPSGGTLLSTGPSFTTPALTATTTYYAEAQGICTSTRVPVQAIISTVTPSPVLTGGSGCGAGTVLLTATATAPVLWFDIPSGGSPVGSGLNFTTPTISATTTYYAEAGTAGCVSPRVSVNAVINPVPAAPTVTGASRCGPGSLTLQANAANTVSWYTAPSGGSPFATGLNYTTPVLAASATYYVEANSTTCVSGRVPVTAVVNAIPADPVTIGDSRCGPGSLTLQANSSAPVSWYAVPSGGSPIGTGLNFTTPNISASTTYYAESGVAGCASQRVAVLANVNPVPPAPSTISDSRCGPGSLQLQANASDPVSWFMTPSGGSPVGNGLSFTTPSISVSTTYYAEAGNAGCVSTRVPASAVINPLPSAPVTIDNSRCGPGVLILQANSADPVTWYTSSSGGIPVGTGVNFTTPSLSVSTTYYAEASSAGCVSPRVGVTATINSVATVPATTGDSRCGPGSLSLQASSSDPVFWYTAPSGGSPVGSGLSFTTPSLSASTVYYAEAGTGACTSTRVAVAAVINPIPPAPAAISDSRCGPGSVTLQAVSTDPVSWYDAPSGGNLVGTGSYFVTSALTATVTYYAISSGVCASPAVAVNAVIHNLPVINIGPDTMYISNGQSITLNAGSGFASYQWSNGMTNSQIQVSNPGSYSVTVTNNDGCTASDAVFINMVTAAISEAWENAITIYPNPASEWITIEMQTKNSEPFVLNIYSMEGKNILRDEIHPLSGRVEKSMNLSGLSNGVYFLEIDGENQSVIKKIIINR